MSRWACQWRTTEIARCIGDFLLNIICGLVWWAEKIKEATDKAMASMAYYKNPVFRFAITVTEILPVGLIISLISAAVLKNKKVLPAQNVA